MILKKFVNKAIATQKTNNQNPKAEAQNMAEHDTPDFKDDGYEDDYLTCAIPLSERIAQCLDDAGNSFQEELPLHILKTPQGIIQVYPNKREHVSHCFCETGEREEEPALYQDVGGELTPDLKKLIQELKIAGLGVLDGSAYGNKGEEQFVLYFSSLEDLIQFLNIVGYYGEKGYTIYDRIIGRWDELRPLPSWVFDFQCFDRAKYVKEVPGSMIVETHPGVPQFGFRAQVFIPLADLETIIERVKKHNAKKPMVY